MLGAAWATPATFEALGMPLPEGWTWKDLPENFWWVVGLCRFEPDELVGLVPDLERVPLDAPLLE